MNNGMETKTEQNEIRLHLESMKYQARILVLSSSFHSSVNRFIKIMSKHSRMQFIFCEFSAKWVLFREIKRVATRETFQGHRTRELYSFTTESDPELLFAIHSCQG